jgi:hypothetical protein
VEVVEPPEEQVAQVAVALAQVNLWMLYQEQQILAVEAVVVQALKLLALVALA